MKKKWKKNINSNRKFFFQFISYLNLIDKLERSYRREIPDPNFEAPSGPISFDLFVL